MELCIKRHISITGHLDIKMPQYAQFDSTASPPAPVIGWYDTDALSYPSLPASGNLFPLTTDQWTAHFTNPSAFAVSGGALISYSPPPPPPTLAQQAANLIASGFTLTSTSASGLDGVYFIGTGQSFGQQDIATEANFISTFSEFTNGATSNLPWPLMNGSLVVFPTTTHFLNFAKAVGQFVAAVKVAVATNASGLPAASGTIA